MKEQKIIYNNQLKQRTMSTNVTMALPLENNLVKLNQDEKTLSKELFTKKERKALKVIYSHPGKKLVYETYLKSNSEMADKYLKFVSRNLWVIYIKWDDKRQKFVA